LNVEIGHKLTLKIEHLTPTSVLGRGALFVLVPHSICLAVVKLPAILVRQWAEEADHRGIKDGDGRAEQLLEEW
jgi:hypothetical protein